MKDTQKVAFFNQQLHERILFLLYQKEYRDLSLTELNSIFKDKSLIRNAFEFGEIPVILAKKIYEHKDELDAIMKEHLSNWKIERVLLIDKIAIRIGIFELLYEQEMKTGIVIDRVIRIVKVYGSESSGRFVNGVLGSVYRKYRNNDDSADITETTETSLQNSNKE
ncbi:MAG: hypothetical protein KAH01_07965 [Caldisericia bacterium]|nr:hypothetical protein [Caldisericia bacterium]